ncbi:unnamed protein product [Sphagnum jensenii]|uniref:Uncharacterized protein n=1 Tax=Sphagnum jensenii TaxID=128206 RepID=A0ABP0VGC3_9BRYO
MAEFLDDGACEIVMNAMNKHCSLSEAITAYCCATVSHLAWSSVEMREFLGELGCCEIIVCCMAFHIGDPKVSEYGSGAVVNLSHENIENSYRLAAAGAIEIMAQLGNFGFNLRNSQSSIVASNTCLALAQMAEALNANKLLECGACELVLNLLKVHRKVDRVVESAVLALCAVASVSTKLRCILGDIDCCEVIVKILKRYDYIPTVTFKACETILHLSVSPGNIHKLIKAHAIDVMMVAFESRMIDTSVGCEICLGTFLNFCKYSTEEDIDKITYKLINMSISDLIRSMKSSNNMSKRCTELGNELLVILGVISPDDLLAEEKENDEAELHLKSSSTTDPSEANRVGDTFSGTAHATSHLSSIMYQLRRTSQELLGADISRLLNVHIDSHEIVENTPRENYNIYGHSAVKPAPAVERDQSVRPAAVNGHHNQNRNNQGPPMSNFHDKENNRKLLKAYDSRMQAPMRDDDDDDES